MTHLPDTTLPPADCDLAALTATLIEGRRRNGWPGRWPDLARHFADLRPEFSGRSEAAWLLARCIVLLRRDISNDHAAGLFRRLIAEQAEALTGQLTLRWLIAVCDTVADLPGAGLADRAIAMIGSTAANLVKLSETERRLYHAPRPWPPKRRFAVGHEMFDGLKAFSPTQGDMIDNLHGRLADLLDDPQAADLPVTPFVAEVLARLTTRDTVLGRMQQIAGRQPVPLVDDDLRDEFVRLSARL